MTQERYTAEYLKIVGDYRERIRLSITGHTHANEFRAYSSRVPVVVLPSISPIYDNNPGFEVLIVDDATLSPEDLEYYALPLQDSAQGPIDWKKRYSFRSEYQLPDLSFKSFGELREKLLSDPGLRKKFVSHLQGGAPGPASRESNWKAYLCALRHAEVAAFLECLCPPPKAQGVQH
jgi:hypothetical protein